MGAWSGSGIGLLSLAATLAGCGDGGGDEQASAAAGADLVIEMTDEMTFEPPRVRVESGAAVAWLNRGGLPHTATLRAGNEPLERRPPGGATWDSGQLQAGERFRVTLSTPGEYRYVCTLHMASGMTGRIEVVAAAPAD